MIEKILLFGFIWMFIMNIYLGYHVITLKKDVAAFCGSVTQAFKIRDEAILDYLKEEKKSD